MSLPTIEHCEDVLGERADAWAGRCYEISCRLVDAGLIRGEAVYGHWLGSVAPGTLFDKGLPFVRHGWILCSRATGRIVDPTRWVFEGVEPYLYEGRPNHLPVGANGWPYDEGGDLLRKAIHDRRPWPDEKPGDRWVRLRLTPELKKRLLIAKHRVRFTTDQVFWLANLSYDLLGPDARDLYLALDQAQQRALVPIDNLMRAGLLKRLSNADLPSRRREQHQRTVRGLSRGSRR